MLNCKTQKLIGSDNSAVTKAFLTLGDCVKLITYLSVVGLLAACGGSTQAVTDVPELLGTGIGNVSPSSRANITKDGFHLRVSGGELATASDSVFLAHKSLFEKSYISARLSVAAGGHSAAMAGLMMRDSLEPDARTVFFGLQQDGRLIMLERSQPGEAANLIQSRQVENAASVTGQWLKLERGSAEIAAFTSDDGLEWHRFAASTAVMPLEELPVLEVGLAAVSGAESYFESKFDKVEVGTLAAANEPEPTEPQPQEPPTVPEEVPEAPEELPETPEDNQEAPEGPENNPDSEPSEPETPETPQPEDQEPEDPEPEDSGPEESPTPEDEAGEQEPESPEPDEPEEPEPNDAPALPEPGVEADYYVSTSGSDSNNGRTESTAFRSVARAVNAARAGDTVFIRGGTYYERVTLFNSGREGAPITFQGYPGETVILDGSSVWGEDVFHIRADWITLRDVIVQNSGQRGVVIERVSNVVIDGVTARYNNHVGIQDESGAWNLIQNCISHDNHDAHNGGGDADGVQTLHSRGTVVRNCVMYNNSDDGFDAWGSRNVVVEDSIAFNNGYDSQGNGSGFKMSQHSDGRTTVRRSVAFNNGLRGFDGNTGGQHIVHNNTSFGHTWTGFADFGSGGSITNNISVDPKTPPGADGMWGNAWQLGIYNPQFISTDPASEQFLSLSWDSPAIDRGTDVGLSYKGSAPDLGALEVGMTLQDLAY